MDRPAGQTSSTDQLDGPAGRISWTEQMDESAGRNRSLYLKPWPVRIFEDWPFSLYIIAASESDEGLVLNQTLFGPNFFHNSKFLGQKLILDPQFDICCWLGFAPTLLTFSFSANQVQILTAYLIKSLMKWSIFTLNCFSIRRYSSLRAAKSSFNPSVKSDATDLFTFNLDFCGIYVSRKSVHCTQPLSLWCLIHA